MDNLVDEAFPIYNANARASTHTNRALPTQTLRRQGLMGGGKGWDKITEISRGKTEKGHVHGCATT